MIIINNLRYEVQEIIVMSEFSNCLLCKSNYLAILKGYEKDHLCKCKRCGFVFSKIDPTYKELQDVYAQYPRNNIISEITLARYDELLLKFQPYRLTNNIIDIGAGDGHFIGKCKSSGWNSYATEFEDRSVELCREKGAIVHKGKLDIGNYNSEMFDIIFSSEVIEHINNPIEEIKNFYKILRKGGLVYITTPNLNSISHTILGPKWNIFNYPEHLCFYTPNTLEKLFVENGFKKINISTTGLSANRFYASQKVSTKCNMDENIRRKTENDFFWKLAKRTINTFLNITGRGDAMKGMFVKI